MQLGQTTQWHTFGIIYRRGYLALHRSPTGCGRPQQRTSIVDAHVFYYVDKFKQQPGSIGYQGPYTIFHQQTADNIDDT